MIGKVNTGDRLRIKAEEWNEIANHVNAGNAARNADFRHDSGEVVIYNPERDFLLRKGMVGFIAGAPTGDLRERPCLPVRRTGQQTEYINNNRQVAVIAQEDIAGQFCGKGRISGYSYALFQDVRRGEEYAEVNQDGFLNSASTGNIKIIYINPNTIELDGKTLYEGFVSFGSDSGGQAGQFDSIAYKDGDQWKVRIYDSRNTNSTMAGSVYVNGGGKDYGVACKEFSLSGNCIIYLEVWYENSDYAATLKQTSGEIEHEEGKWQTVICYVTQNSTTNDYHCRNPRGLGAVQIEGVWA